MAPYYGPPARILYIPAGLLMLFFGGFLVRPALLLLSCLLASHLAYQSSLHLGLPAHPALLLSILAALSALLIASEAVEHGPDFVTGFLLGICVALTLYPAPLSSLFVAVSVLAPAFGLVFALVPKEVGVFFTSYAGAYMIFYGMQLIDSEVFEGSNDVPAFVQSDNVDMWFSVLSFLVVGLLGCCVQLILYSGQAQNTVSRSHYVDIP